MPNCPGCRGPLAENEQTCSHCGADTSWWLAREGEVYGPYDTATVRYILAEGRATLGDPAMIGREGHWSTVGQLLEAGPEQPAHQPETLAAPSTGSGPKPARYRGWSFAGWLIYIGVLMAACVGIAAAIIWPVQRGIEREKAAAVSEANLRQVGVALELYAHHSGGRLPAAGAWEQAVARYLPTPEAYRSGIDGSPQPFWYNEGLSGVDLKPLRNVKGLVLVAEPGAVPERLGDVIPRVDNVPRPEGFYFFYTDGSAAAHAPGADYGILKPAATSPPAGR